MRASLALSPLLVDVLVASARDTVKLDDAIVTWTDLVLIPETRLRALGDLWRLKGVHTNTIIVMQSSISEQTLPVFKPKGSECLG